MNHGRRMLLTPAFGDTECLTAHTYSYNGGCATDYTTTSGSAQDKRIAYIGCFEAHIAGLYSSDTDKQTVRGIFQTWENGTASNKPTNQNLPIYY